MHGQSRTPEPAFSKWTALPTGDLDAVAGDAGGNVYVAARTTQGTANADSYVAKVGPDGAVLYKTDFKANRVRGLAPGNAGSVWAWSGGLWKLDTRGQAVVVSPTLYVYCGASDAEGNLYIAGYSPGEYSILVTKLNNSGVPVASFHSGILGAPSAMAVDRTGAVYLVGQASNLFVATPGAFQTSHPQWDYNEAFAAKIAPELDRVVYATLLSGRGEYDYALAVAAGSAGEAIVAGQVYDPENRFIPRTQAGVPLFSSDKIEAYVVKLSADGSHLVYALGLGPGCVNSLALASDGRVHAAGFIGERGIPIDETSAHPSATVGLFTVDPGGVVQRQQYLTPVPQLIPVPLSAHAGVVAALDGSPRFVANSGSTRFPPVQLDHSSAPYVIDSSASPSVADLSITAALAQPLVMDAVLAIRVTVTNAGPADAEGIHIVSDRYLHDIQCLPGAGTMCYAPGFGAISHLGVGESASLEFQFDSSLSAGPSGATTRFQVFAATSDSNMANNAYTLNAPLTNPSHPIHITPNGLIFFHSDQPGVPGCPNIKYCQGTVDPNLSVWVPSPQAIDGNLWYFDSWSDGARDNPRTMDASKPLPTLSINSHAASPVSVEPSSLDFVVMAGASPQARTVTLLTTASAQILSLGSPADSWFSVSGTFNGIREDVQGKVTASDLAPGYYTSSFSVKSQIGDATQVIQVPVSLRVMDQPAIITPGGVVNAASYASGPISSGEIISIFGKGLGPKEGVAAAVSQAGHLPYTLAGTSVASAELLFVQDQQIVAVLSAGVGTKIQVYLGGVPGPAVEAGNASAAPGLFTSDASGKGNLAAVNSDGTINSPSHPAKRGTYVSLFGTGFTFDPFMIETSQFLLKFDGNVLGAVPGIVDAYVGTEPAEVQYAGVVPGFTLGMQQVNILIPADSATGPAVPVRVGVVATGGATSAWAQDGATLAIQ